MRGLFYGIGHTPNSRLVEGQVELDDKGYVKVSILIEHLPVLCSVGNVTHQCWATCSDIR